MIFTSEIPEKIWENFTASHPMGNIFQSPLLYHVYEKTKNYEPIAMGVMDESLEKLYGILSGVIIRENNGLIGKFSSRLVIQGGPLLKENIDTNTLSTFLQHFDENNREKCVYSEIRNLNENAGLEKISNYRYFDHLNFLINLDQTKEQIWRQIQKARRKNINRAEKYGVIIEELKQIDQISQFYELLKVTSHHAKIPLADISLFYAAFSELIDNNHVKFFLAKSNGELIGVRAVLMYNSIIYDWYAGARAEFLSLYPNEALVWYILKWGKENNFKIFDFGGAGEPDIPYGPREFKRRFGGELVNYGRYRNIYSPFKLKLAELGFAALRKVYY